MTDENVALNRGVRRCLENDQPDGRIILAKNALISGLASASASAAGVDVRILAVTIRVANPGPSFRFLVRRSGR